MKIDKRRIVEKLIKVPKTDVKRFWARESTLLNRLAEKYPLEFLITLSFNQKFNSMAIFFSEGMEKKIQQLYKEYNYKPREYEKSEYFVGEKYGSDRIIHKGQRTIRDFFNE